MEYITWACENMQVNGILTEHVSFQSFVRKFGINSKEVAMSHYVQLLNSSRLSATRRERLKATYNDFVKAHLDSFWLEWDREEASHEFDVSCETVTKRTAALAQQASLAISARGFSAVQANNSTAVHNLPTDADQKRLTQKPPTSRLSFLAGKQRAQGTDEASSGKLQSAIPFSETTSSTSPMAPTPLSPSKRRKSFTKKNRRSLEGRYHALGEKWILASGTIVEDVLYTAGSDEDCASFSPIHSFMLDLDDAKTKALFSEEDWKEIISDLPPYEHYGKGAGEYLDNCMEVASREDMRKLLEKRQDDPECKIIYYCMDQWEELLSSESSPFPVAAQLGETWWKDNAWGVCRRLATGIKDAFIILGEKTGHDSSDRRNQDIGTIDRKKIGAKADFLWRTVSSPDIDWSVGESATLWDPSSMKYRNEGVFKLPRQLHDILVARTSEVGGVDSLRKEYICGLLTGGPVIQRVQICWGTKGVNITRFFRSPERRLFPTVQELGISLMAVHDLLILRATTLRLCNKYQESRREFSKASSKARLQELLLSSVSPRDKKRKFGLLSSSP